MHSQTKLNENFAQNKKPTAASCDVPKRFGAWDPATQVHGNHISNGGLSGGWRETNEAVRDFHRDLEAHDATPSRKPPRHGSTDTLMQFRLHPEIGTASDLAKPGGFRRFLGQKLEVTELLAA